MDPFAADPSETVKATEAAKPSAARAADVVTVAPAGMNPASPKLATARLLTLSVWLVLGLVAAGVLIFYQESAGWWVLGGTVVLALWLLWLIPAQVRLLGWQETEDELLIKKGKLWHSFTVVPYGRIQFVDVTAGPIARALGLKKVKLHTASAGTDATINGLLAADADALRERLTVKARERMSGL